MRKRSLEETIQTLIDIVNTIDRRIASLDSILNRSLTPAPRTGIDYSQLDTLTLLQLFINSNDIRALQEAVSRIMKSEQCSFCRVMASSAYMEAMVGNVDRAKNYAKEILKFYFESGGEK